MIKQFEGQNIISASFHTLHDLNENDFPYQYVFLSPVFDSISKPGYSAKFELKRLAEELKLIKNKNPFLPKVIALGGISAKNIIQVKEAGFSGAALLGAIWESANPVQAYQHIQSILQTK